MGPLQHGRSYKTIKFNDLDEFMCCVHELLDYSKGGPSIVIIVQQEAQFEIVCVAVANYFCDWDSSSFNLDKSVFVIEKYSTRSLIWVSNDPHWVLSEEQRTQNIKSADHIIYLTIIED